MYLSIERKYNLYEKKKRKIYKSIYFGNKSYQKMEKPHNEKNIKKIFQ